jgi:hypothetical protein
LTLDPHTIRLRGPWQLEPLARFMLQADGSCGEESGDLPSAARAKMPSDWIATLGRHFLGRVRYRRTFQMPTGLDEGQRVFLVVEPPRSRGTVHLGDELLGQVRQGDPPGRFDITERLQEHNYLTIVVEHPALDAAARPIDDNTAHLAGGLVGEVRLEIEE